MSEKNDNVTIRERLSSLFNKTKDSTETRCDNPKDIAYQNLIKNIICNQNIENFKVSVSTLLHTYSKQILSIVYLLSHLK